jgi:hypothetical protein
MGKISFTSDLWSSESRASWLSLTGHWIAKKGKTMKLKHALIGFHPVRGKHSGERLARIVLHLLDRAEITGQVKNLFLYICNADAEP